jgi:acyl carrier protein phosphodiesterase
MNYLAHLYLSGTNDDVLLGNFIADGIKGEDKSNYKPFVIQGIKLHKKIDAYTDRHKIFKRSAKRLTPKYRHYAGVIVDIFYDHFLAKNWSEYHHQPLDEYALSIYQFLDSRNDELPLQSQRFLWYMKKYNILYNYGNLDGIAQVLSGLSQRARFDSKMDQATQDLKNLYDDYESDFNAFFPDLELFVQEQDEFIIDLY